ncbi:beta-mannosidase [Amycolatopsis acidiphila]|uniref:Beta-mannosidase n=1 Tax=Amycolatopsis acidiphila TaxID=715473 RepID=A0A557ZZB5_9PSEU|nr:sugar-binding domain-containing protein [Amycolatopsis acidiphila]TVT17337.1 beta-mannosidase [Amycolatopsis acidiphila]UIJ60650.1 beta-mannosidase [Amycolatopsis acidiphila]GHG98281.1 beta-mannosidase [Amycolatopsis acidiphila]
MKLALGAVVLAATALLSPPAQAQPAPTGLITVGTQGWQVQSSAVANGSAEDISNPAYRTTNWLPVKPDDAGAPGTEINALVQNGACPDVFYSDNMRKCFGYVDKLGPVTVPRFAVPWWFRTDFTLNAKPGQDVKMTIPGVVGEADLWVDGKQVAGRDVVSGAFAGHTFDITRFVRQGKNSLAVKMYPNDPAKMYTLDQVDWNQFPPDNNTGIQYPIQLQISDALTGSNAHVTQQNAADLSSSTLTAKLDVTNNAGREQRGDVTATITPPGGGKPIVVRQTVSVPADSTKTVTFAPVTITHPKLWWPYSMGGQPLYTLSTAVAQNGKVSTTSSDTFGIRTVTTRLVGGSPQLPDGARIFAVNGKEFVFRGGGYAPDLFLRYSKSDVAHQVQLIKNMGLTGVRLEGHDMPQDFYEQMDRAGLLVLGGFLCCDAWQPDSEANLTDRDFAIMHDSARSIGERERNHPSVITYGWSDNEPLPRQEQESLAGFAEADFQVPIIASAEYKSTPTLGQAGEKEGPYDWVPPSYWYDTSHFDPDDPSRTNVGGSWGFASEQSAGDTVPTLDSIKRFLSPEEQAELWQDPAYNQYHANFESGHGGYAFGTLYTFDTALKARYGNWSSLDNYVQLAQVQNYENTRSQFEAFLDHSTDKANPATGIVYWQLNKGWPTLLWSLYNYDGDQPGSYYGAQKANKPLHALLGYDDNKVTVDNLGAGTQRDLSVEAKVYDLGGKLVDDQQAGDLSLAGQEVRNGVLQPKLPTTGSVYFVELVLSRRGQVVDRNTYWRSTKPDVVDWAATMGNPQATMTQYADFSALQALPKTSVRALASTPRPGVTTVTLTNTSDKVAFFLRADVRTGGAQVPSATWDDNDITLWPGESQTLTATYDPVAHPQVSVAGFNTPAVTVAG